MRFPFYFSINIKYEDLAKNNINLLKIEPKVYFCGKIIHFQFTMNGHMSKQTELGDS